MSYETNVGTVRKQPSETTGVIGVGFGAHLSGSESISSFTLVVTDEQGNDVTSTLLFDSSKTTSDIQFRIKEGEHGTRYLVTIVATLSNGSVAEREVTILVSNNQFASNDISFSVGECLPLVTESLGTKVETGARTADDKISAIFQAYHELLTVRKPEEAFEADWTVYFTDKKAALPPKYLIWIKLFDADNPAYEYKKVSVNEFDTLSGFYWTVKKDSYGQDKLMIARTAVAAKVRYLAQPTTFTTVNDRIMLPRYYMQPIAKMAAARISNNARDYADAAAQMRESDRYLEQSGGIHAEQQRHASEARVRSIFDSESLFNDNL